MLTLRLTQETTDKADEYRARLRLEGNGAPYEAAATFSFRLSDPDQKDIRWYLEAAVAGEIQKTQQLLALIEQAMGTGKDEG